MIKINFDYLSKIATKYGISKTQWKKVLLESNKLIFDFKKNIPDYLEILEDEEAQRAVKSYAHSVRGKFDNIVVLGIGGSALGALCLDSALRSVKENDDCEDFMITHCEEYCESNVMCDSRAEYTKTVVSRYSYPKLTVLDNIDPDLLADFEKNIDYDKTLFLVISKSGNTPETLAQFLYFQKKLFNSVSNWGEHFVFVTGSKGGQLRDWAVEAKAKNIPITVFDIPEGVGGRFSVLTVVGLLPAALSGISIDELIEGAKCMKKNVILKNTVSNKIAIKNPALALASAQYLLMKKGYNQQVFYVYKQKLRAFADWYRQLLAESVGKKLNKRGKVVYAGLTPLCAVGVTDQHSQNQLYMEGPNDKLFLIMSVLKPNEDFRIADSKNSLCFKSSPYSQYLLGHTFNELFQAECKGTLKALVNEQRPVIEITVPQLDARTLGELFVLFEVSISFLAELLDLNAYDQPGVELSKILTRKLL